MPGYLATVTVASTRCTVGTLLLGALACGGDPAGPSFPELAGTYAAAFRVEFENAIEAFTDTETGTITLTAPTPDGSFTGTFDVANADASGVVEGTVRADGAITLNVFGHPSTRPAERIEYLRDIINWCDWHLAAVAEFSGAISNRTVTFSGSIQLPCHYTDPDEIAPTAITLLYTGTR